MADLDRRVIKLERTVQQLLDRQEIHDVLMRYCRGVDRLDDDLIAQAFHPDATVDHGAHMSAAASDVAQKIRAVWGHVRSSMHFVGNELIEVNGDSARSECYFIAFGLVDDGPRLLSRGARYVDRWERREGAWRITRRVVLGEWDRVDPIAERWPEASGFLAGVRSADDASYPVIPVARGRGAPRA